MSQAKAGAPMPDTGQRTKGVDDAIRELGDKIRSFGTIDHASVTRPYKEGQWWRVAVAVHGPDRSWVFAPRVKVPDNATLIHLAAREMLADVT